jgi:hypothetical protein
MDREVALDDWIILVEAYIQIQAAADECATPTIDTSHLSGGVGWAPPLLCMNLGLDSGKKCISMQTICPAGGRSEGGSGRVEGAWKGVLRCRG